MIQLGTMQIELNPAVLDSLKKFQRQKKKENGFETSLTSWVNAIVAVALIRSGKVKK